MKWFNSLERNSVVTFGVILQSIILQSLCYRRALHAVSILIEKRIPVLCFFLKKNAVFTKLMHLTKQLILQLFQKYVYHMHFAVFIISHCCCELTNSLYGVKM